MLVLILGSANVRVGLAMDEKPFNVPNCIARYMTQTGKPTVVDQVLSIFALIYFVLLFMNFNGVFFVNSRCLTLRLLRINMLTVRELIIL